MSTDEFPGTQPDEMLLTEVVQPAPVPPPQPVHIMLDLETWGVQSNAAIISIGAAKFTATEILNTFHQAIDPQTIRGATFDVGTIMWWIDPERRGALDRWLSLDKIDLDSALHGFSEWVHMDGPVEAIWGNGATFDNVILRSAYAACGIEYPVSYGQDQCYRTLKYRAPEVELVRSGTHHDALDDAVSQTRHLQAIIAKTGVTL
jgi:exodeoxyribonuclease VIII